MHLQRAQDLARVEVVEYNAPIDATNGEHGAFAVESACRRYAFFNGVLYELGVVCFWGVYEVGCCIIVSGD